MVKVSKGILKSTIKSNTKTNINIRPATQSMVELGMLLFINSLAVEARTKAFEDKSATIRAHHLIAVSKKILKKSRG